ncbi:MAG: hypothetical protein V4700_04625 [Pseudomonadota bacterium]
MPNFIFRYFKNRQIRKKKKFNFNPIEIDHFIEEIFKKVGNEDFKARRIDLAGLSVGECKKNSASQEKKKIIWNLLADTREIRGKIKVTYKRFDIEKVPIPKELLMGSKDKDIAWNTMACSLAPGYLVSQIYVVFKTTDKKYNSWPEGNNKKEELSKLLLLVTKFKDLAKNDAKKNEVLTVLEVLEKIKKSGKEGKKMHDLLCHLISPPAENDDSIPCSRDTFGI